MDIAKLHFLDTFGLDSLKVTVYRSTNGYCRYLFGHILSIFQRNDYGKTIWVPKTCHGHQKMVIYPLNVEWVKAPFIQISSIASFKTFLIAWLWEYCIFSDSSVVSLKSSPWPKYTQNGTIFQKKKNHVLPSNFFFFFKYVFLFDCSYKLPLRCNEEWVVQPNKNVKISSVTTDNWLRQR